MNTCENQENTNKIVDTHSGRHNLFKAMVNQFLMVWPLTYDTQGRFVWDQEFQPEFLAGQHLDLEKVATLLVDYEPAFPQRFTVFESYQYSKDTISHLWQIIMIGLVPLLWFFIIFQIMAEFRNRSESIAGLEFTLLFVLLLGLSFAGVGLYGIYRRHQDRLDLLDQLDILHYAFPDQSPTVEDLQELLEVRDGRIYWKYYQVNWELSNLFPTLSIFDILAIFLAIFNQVYILVWSLNLLFLPLSSDLSLGENLYVLLVILIFLPTLLSLIYLGYSFGKHQARVLSFFDTDSSRFHKKHLMTVAIAILLLIVLDLIFSRLSPVFIVIILFAQLPLMSAFVTSRLIYLRDYLRIRTAYGRQLEFLQISHPPQQLDPVHLAEALNRLDNQSILPTSRLRSYLLVTTAVVSLLIPLLTGFYSSVTRLEDILRIILPF